MNVIERNNVKVTGSGKTPIIFAHGFGCDQHVWRLVAPAFESRYRVVLFDHVGSGKSDTASYDRMKYGSLRGYADDLNEICAALDLTGAILVGHSVSAMIGALAAIAAPRNFSRLVMVGPSPCYVDEPGYVGGFSRETIAGVLQTVESDFEAWARAMAPIVMGNPDRPELGADLARVFCRNKPEIAKHFARVTFLGDNRADLARIPTPTLVMQCAEDAFAPEVVGRFVQARIPRAELLLMRATGHCPHLSAPEETIAGIEAYLARPAREAA